MSIYPEHIDIRDYPAHDWEAKRLTAKVNGRWTYFYGPRDDNPLNTAKQCGTLTPLSRPGTVNLSMKSLTSSIPRFIEERKVDSYDLLRRQRLKERAQQSLRLSAISLLDHPRPKSDLLTRTPDQAKRERAMRQSPPTHLQIELPETPMIIHSCQPRQSPSEKASDSGTDGEERKIDLGRLAKRRV